MPTQKPSRMRALPDKAERMMKANEFIKIIATHGRKFFNYKGSISWLLLDSQGRIVFFDSFSKRYVYIYGNGSWKGFTNGGTLRTLIIHLREYIQGKIKTGDELFKVLPIRLDWGYPEADMTIVTEAARRIFCHAGKTHETQGETAP